MSKQNSAGIIDTTSRTRGTNQLQWSQKKIKCKENERSDDRKVLFINEQ